MKPIRIFLLILLLSMPAHACLWVDGTTLDGHRHSVGGYGLGNQLKGSMARSAEDKLEWLERNRGTSSRDEFADREMDGVRRVLEGKPVEAIEIFKKIEADHPGRYSTAANLGTAYELNGELGPALRWITEGIRRNPKSHHGTEWLHQEIIKARMKLAADPTYLWKNSIIAVPAAISATSRISISGVEYPFHKVEDALAYQLEERMIFVKPPDPVVADLLFSFGELEARTATVEAGIELLEMARTYGFQDVARLERTFGEYKWAIRLGKIRWFGLILSGVLGFVALLVFAWRKKWLFLTGSTYRKHQQEKVRSRRLSGDAR